MTGLDQIQKKLWRGEGGHGNSVLHLPNRLDLTTPTHISKGPWEILLYSQPSEVNQTPPQAQPSLPSAVERHHKLCRETLTAIWNSLLGLPNKWVAKYYLVPCMPFSFYRPSGEIRLCCRASNSWTSSEQLLYLLSCGPHELGNFTMATSSLEQLCGPLL